VLVFNKIDLLDPSQRPLQDSDMFELDGRPVPRLFVSGQSGSGLPALRRYLAGVASRESSKTFEINTPSLHDSVM
jgi:GTPase